MEEMRQLINKRSGEVAPRSHHGGQRGTAAAGGDGGRTIEFLTSIEESVSEADKSLVRAAASQEALSINISLLAADLKEVSPLVINHPHQSANFLSQKASLLEKSRVELQSTKRQCVLVKSLLADATAENEIMYEVSQTNSLGLDAERVGYLPRCIFFLMISDRRHLMKSLMVCSMMRTFPTRMPGLQ
jgi:hypothetical protein